LDQHGRGRGGKRKRVNGRGNDGNRRGKTPNGQGDKGIRKGVWVLLVRHSDRISKIISRRLGGIKPENGLGLYRSSSKRRGSEGKKKHGTELSLKNGAVGRPMGRAKSLEQDGGKKTSSSVFVSGLAGKRGYVARRLARRGKGEKEFQKDREEN